MPDGKPVDYFGVAIHDDPDGGTYENPDIVRSPDGHWSSDLRPGRWFYVRRPELSARRHQEHRCCRGQDRRPRRHAVSHGRRPRVTDGSGVPVGMRSSRSPRADDHDRGRPARR
jgi:hypothetical protein